jgi:hypothetical protein
MNQHKMFSIDGLHIHRVGNVDLLMEPGDETVALIIENDGYRHSDVLASSSTRNRDASQLELFKLYSAWRQSPDGVEVSLHLPRLRQNPEKH